MAEQNSAEMIVSSALLPFALLYPVFPIKLLTIKPKKAPLIFKGPCRICSRFGLKKQVFVNIRVIRSGSGLESAVLWVSEGAVGETPRHAQLVFLDSGVPAGQSLVEAMPLLAGPQQFLDLLLLPDARLLHPAVVEVLD